MHDAAIWWLDKQIVADRLGEKTRIQSTMEPAVFTLFPFYTSSDIPWPGLNIIRKSEISISMERKSSRRSLLDEAQGWERGLLVVTSRESRVHRCLNFEGRESPPFREAVVPRGRDKSLLLFFPIGHLLRPRTQAYVWKYVIEVGQWSPSYLSRGRKREPWGPRKYRRDHGEGEDGERDFISYL